MNYEIRNPGQVAWATYDDEDEAREEAIRTGMRLYAVDDDGERTEIDPHIPTGATQL